MNFITSITALLGLVATAVCTAVPRAVLPDCTEVNNGTVTCASSNVFNNSILKCVDLKWNYVDMCNEPYTRCLDGACVSTSPNQEPNDNDDTGYKNYDLSPVVPRENAIIAAGHCSEGQLKCMAQNGQGKDGAVYKCTNGFWRIIQDCRSSERCVSKPVPHCAW